jgi:hypothetical protein
MKKFLFIIPINSFLCIVSVIVFVFTFLKFTPSYGIDYYGCHVLAGSTQRVYLTEVAPFDHTKFTGTLSGLGGYTDQSTGECLDDLGPTCTVYYGDGMGGTTTTEYKSGFYGHLYDNCPIDDYIPVLFIFTVLIVMFKMINLRQINESKFNHRSL